MKGVITCLFLGACFLSSQQCVAQYTEDLRTSPNGFLPSLVMENSKNHKIRTLRLDHTVWYKVAGSDHFKKGKLDWITDTTVTFKFWDAENITILRKDLNALKIRKGSWPFTILGSGIIVFGASVLISTLTAFSSPSDPFTTLVYSGPVAGTGTAILVSVVATIVGLAVMSPKRTMKLGEAWIWTIKWTPVMDAFKPGSVICLTLKSGEVIDKMRTAEVDPEKIVGKQILQDAYGHDVFRSRTILIGDIGAIQKYEKKKQDRIN